VSQPIQLGDRRYGFGQVLGLRIAAAEAGVATIEMDAGPDHLNLGGIVHGGVISTLVDVAVAVACHSMDSQASPRAQATTELNVTFLRAAGPGRLTCQARIRRRGRSLAVGEAEVSDGAGRLVAVGRATYLVGGNGPRPGSGAADDALDLGGSPASGA
jgi:uncharacterized protein (TIGR00369 family)